MKKNFTYNGYEFTFAIQLHWRLERSPTGRREHKMIVSYSGSIIYKQEYILDARKPLEPQIKEAEKAVMFWVDGLKIQDDGESELISLGFTKA